MSLLKSISLKNIFANKIFIYLFSRYITYFIQFVTSIFIAVKLGPYYFGIWGFILLMIAYFNKINFGIAYSNNILLIQNKDNPKITADYIASSIILIGVYALFVFVLALTIWVFDLTIFEKYELGDLVYIILIVGVLLQFNNLFMTVYRVKNGFFHIALYQTIIPILVFSTIFIFQGRALLNVLLFMYLLGHLIALLVFIKGGKIPFGGRPSLNHIKTIVHKGFLLFIYNASFYFIIISVRTIISSAYTVEEFGYFSFSFSLANSVILFIDAMTFLLFSKVINSLVSNDMPKVKSTIDRIRKTYVPLSHVLIYSIIMIYPYAISLIPKYQSTIISFNLIATTLILQSNFYAQTTFLMAKNKEKILAIVSLGVLIINIVIALVIVRVFNANYQYVIISTQISYLLMSFLFIYYTKRILKENLSFANLMRDWFPYKLLIPYILTLLLVLTEHNQLLFLPLVVFLMMNFDSIKLIKDTMVVFIKKPNIVDVS